VATISSLNCGEELIRNLFEAGMNVARLNTAHMTPDEAAVVVKSIRSVSDQIAILIDTKGPNIRSGSMEPLAVDEGEEVQVLRNTEGASGKFFQVNYSRFIDEVTPGEHILINDGEVDLEIIRKEREMLVCRTLNSGVIRQYKSINVPGAKLRAPALTERDREFIKFAIDNNLDFIAHSFVRNRDDIMAVQSILDTADSPIHIIAKIENREGVDHLDSIMDACAGIMVARGDLGIEIPLEEVPIIQKRIIRECMTRRKVVITATQMLQSMTEHQRPTRAEVSDVANAVFDGTDAVMLSEETAQGKYPVKAVQMMSRIIRETELMGNTHFVRPEKVYDAGEPITSYMVKMAIASGDSLPVKAIICNTASGNSCRTIAAYRAPILVFALSYRPIVVRQLALSYGVYAGGSEYLDSPDKLIKHSVGQLVAEEKITKNDLVVLVGKHLAHGEASLCGIFRAGAVLED
jgi:pyruvate kinase